MFHDWKCPTLHVHLMLVASNSISIIACVGCSQNLSSFEEFDGKWDCFLYFCLCQVTCKEVVHKCWAFIHFQCFRGGMQLIQRERERERGRENVCARTCNLFYKVMFVWRVLKMDITNFITNGCGNLFVLHHVSYLTIILPHNLLNQFLLFF